MTRKDYIAFIDTLATGLNKVNPAQWRETDTKSAALTPIELTVARASLHAAGKAFAYIAKQDNPRFDERRFDKALCDALGILNSDSQPEL